MKSAKSMRIAVIVLFTALATPVRLAAQGEMQAPRHYTVTDLGTLGGSFSTALGNNNKGLVTGLSSLPGDQNAHAFLWRKGVMTDLGTLGGPNSVPAFAPPNERGEVGGGAETSTPDPNGEDFCFFGTQHLCLPVIWHDGTITVLPTLGGNNAVVNQVNNRGQGAGVAENTTLGPTCFAPTNVLEFKPVVYEKDAIHELPTLAADPDGVALAINDNGQVAGFSASCTDGHALLWQNGTATDLGSLGGTFGVANAINNKGQVVGNSNLLGDTTSHAFLWENGIMTDLGTLPGDFGSVALGINNKGQVVGDSANESGEHPFLWQNSVMTDLNSLIPAGSSLFLIDANGINSRGEIAGLAFDTSTGELHGYLATPSNSEVPNGSAATAAPSGASEMPNVVLPEKVRRMLQRRLESRYHFPSLGAMKE
jgi:probable HAF family extracellular repeat protein